jgi:hypothetical protein
LIAVQQEKMDVSGELVTVRGGHVPDRSELCGACPYV